MANAKIKHLQLPNGTTYDFHAVTADSATSATTASKLSVNAGSATNPIYFTSGVPTACTYSLNKTVPSDAVFTDHTYNFSGTTFYSGNSGNAEHNCNNAIKNGVYYYTSNGAATSIGASATDGALYVQAYSDSWVGQICQDYRNGNLFTRGKNNGTWTDWRKIMYSDDTYGGTLTKSQITTALGYTPPTSDTNNAVTQTECNTNASYELLFANSAGTGTETAGVKKNSGLYYNAVDGDRALIIRSKDNTYSTSIRPLEITTNGRIIVQNTSEQKDIKLKGGAGYVRFATDIPANGKVYVEGQTLNATKNLISMDSSGNVFVSGTSVKIDTNNNLTATGELVSGSGLELGNASADAASFIDFHWNNNTNDYTARIIQRGESTVDLIGKNSSTWGIWRAASFSSQSSIHVKENVQSITAEDAKRLLQLRPVTFNYKNGGLTDQVGLIAEEVNLVMPKMVIGDINFNPEEPWNAPSIDYSKFTPYLIKMVQEQQKEIDELRRLVQG